MADGRRAATWPQPGAAGAAAAEAACAECKGFSEVAPGMGSMTEMEAGAGAQQRHGAEWELGRRGTGVAAGEAACVDDIISDMFMFRDVSQAAAGRAALFPRTRGATPAALRPLLLRRGAAPSPQRPAAAAAAAPDAAAAPAAAGVPVSSQPPAAAPAPEGLSSGRGGGRGRGRAAVKAVKPVKPVKPVYSRSYEAVRRYRARKKRADELGIPLCELPFEPGEAPPRGRPPKATSVKAPDAPPLQPPPGPQLPAAGPRRRHGDDARAGAGGVEALVREVAEKLEEVKLLTRENRVLQAREAVLQAALGGHETDIAAAAAACTRQGACGGAAAGWRPGEQQEEQQQRRQGQEQGPAEAQAVVGMIEAEVPAATAPGSGADVVQETEQRQQDRPDGLRLREMSTLTT
ncbi:hypothetical protein MNEG_10201 [Monoraphidium neglectum]|uniref:Uncharacterized protein n=1 Tax=Monoraphidium neglectum TaxID=145388 RepID=A0A0D2JDY0_9CHLO|nr:hypothetical protein MNEG_10201 [Monoraphidium neglectum]KIY97762.1 hypothetical protein MNEG_10201 [Monoraphidium neglectum]|eukprot:XP_013896782.1 hypothetical protein MNEG_10201 [Monoraphidium neglectum]